MNRKKKRVLASAAHIVNIGRNKEGEKEKGWEERRELKRKRGKTTEEKELEKTEKTQPHLPAPLTTVCTNFGKIIMMQTTCLALPRKSLHLQLLFANQTWKHECFIRMFGHQFVTHPGKA